jgi:hypothetical protein
MNYSFSISDQDIDLLIRSLEYLRDRTKKQESIDAYSAFTAS